MASLHLQGSRSSPDSNHWFTTSFLQRKVPKSDARSVGQDLFLFRPARCSNCAPGDVLKVISYFNLISTSCRRVCTRFSPDLVSTDWPDSEGVNMHRIFATTTEPQRGKRMEECFFKLSALTPSATNSTIQIHIKNKIKKELEPWHWRLPCRDCFDWSCRGWDSEWGKSIPGSRTVPVCNLGFS